MESLDILSTERFAKLVLLQHLTIFIVTFHQRYTYPFKFQSYIMIKVIIQKSRREVSPIEQYTIDCKFSPI